MKTNGTAPTELELMNKFLDLVFMESRGHLDALNQVGATLTQLVAWRKGEQFKVAYRERETLLRTLVIERAIVSGANSFRKKADLGEIDGQSLVAGVRQFQEALGWDQPVEQQAAAANPSTGLPFLNSVFNPTLQREQSKKPETTEAKTMLKTKGTKKGKGGKGGC